VPRFNKSASDWENDKSEIRRARFGYFTIGHVLSTGLVIPGVDKRLTFANTRAYLNFFESVLVRGAGSIHQDALAERYSRFVMASDDPSSVPLLIPELRYRGRDRRHNYRLDFCVVDPFSLNKIGFELSPWSSHGRLDEIRTKTLRALNAQAQLNFEREIEKLGAYFDRYGIHVVVFTDAALEDPDAVFQRVERYLRPEERSVQLLIHAKQQIIDMDLESEVESEDGEE